MRIIVTNSRGGTIAITGKDADGNTITESVQIYRYNWFESIVWRICTWLKLHRPFNQVIKITINEKGEIIEGRENIGEDHGTQQR